VVVSFRGSAALDNWLADLLVRAASLGAGGWLGRIWGLVVGLGGFGGWRGGGL